MTIVLNILIFLITGGLIATTTARLNRPLNFGVTGLVFIVLATLAFKLYGLGWFSVLYVLWMAGVFGGLFWLRGYLRGEKKAR
ncbi:hypothetical protein ACFQ3L_08625 [Lacticaseibacillus jixianensis]|uniref:Uncharacterized protein n=1 Tax=Lacticaseibacillus jixianensis TaxID=2486012 RepID=A0ABW4BA77_9LACO|nr:hypothetical protein [Lacticaseibacillus jixianensis]